ncbi:MAG: ATP-dependent DNA helicase RecG [Gammaproteobacteria bacterium]
MRTATPGAPPHSELTENRPASHRLGVPRDPCVSTLKGVGPQMHRILRDLGLETVSSLIFHLPHRYEDHTRITPLNQLPFGEKVVVEGQITALHESKTHPKKIRCQLSDRSGTVTLVFFHGAQYLKNQLQVGKTIRGVGAVNPFQGQRQITHPQLMDADQPLAETLTPIYPTSKNLTQARLRTFIDQALTLAHQRDWLKDLLPPSILRDENLPTFTEAITALHRPPPLARHDHAFLQRAHQRISLECLIAHFLGLARLHDAQSTPNQSLSLSVEQRETLLNCFPFTLTEDQHNALSHLHTPPNTDTAPKLPQHLLQGDVGSGKTVLAAALAYAAYCHNGQAAVMAPTELLAYQHATQFEQWFSHLGIRIAFFSSRLSHRERREQLAALAEGKIDIAIGTQALIQADVHFNNLLAGVIDEQHRFGVEQRLALKEKGCNPHILYMTATPIPRTLAMSLYGDLNTIEIKARPAGRKPITTTVMCDTHRDALLDAIKTKCQNGERVFWVCPRIRTDPEPDTQDVATGLAAEYALTYFQEKLPELRIGLLHGQMPDTQKSSILDDFRQQKLHILVATTVIEVGIDIPAATVIVIESAERFGLSQLHQLRGRVGRGEADSYCILLYQHPLNEKGKARLAALRSSSDGFVLAEHDLAQRGPGLWLGAAQSGAFDRVFDAYTCPSHLIDCAKSVATHLHEQTPDIAKALYTRWQSKHIRYIEA